MAKDRNFKENESWKSCFKSDYLGSQDLPDRKDIILTIAGVLKQDVVGSGNSKQERPILHFVEKVKPMICNVTNAKVISTLANSTLPVKWEGLRIQVYIKENVSAFGTVGDALRIRDFTPRAPQKPVLKEGTPAFTGAIEFIKSGHSIAEIEKKYSISSNVKKILEDGSRN